MRKKLIRIAVIALSAFAFAGCNLPQSENGLKFYLNRSTQEYTVYAGDGLSTDVVIPSEFKGRPVTKILDRGFSNNAKNGSVRVGKTDKIKSIFIPASIKEIGGSLFVGCIELESITVAESNPFYKSDDNCLIEIATNMVIAGCGASIIPDYIIGIARYAFHGTKLWINAPNDEVFYVSKWAVGFKGNLDETIILETDTVGIGDGAFAGCYQLENIRLSSALTSIGGFAFSSCSSLVSIVIPLSVTHIAYSTFSNCTSLATIYAESADEPDGWQNGWKPANCSVIWSYSG